MTDLMSTLSTFSTWMKNHTTWSDLKEWLQKPENSVEILEFEGSPYVILKSIRDSEVEVDEVVSEATQLCRSVVWNTDTNSPCSIAPFAAQRDQKIPMGVPLRLDDFVEGVMINVFRARDDDVTHVTTRSKLNADGTFYSSQTFRELFDEALNAKGVTLEAIEKVMGSPNQDNVIATFMSLVLVHPEHRVVKTVAKANFWAINRGVVKTDGTIHFFTEDLPSDWRPNTYSSNFQATEWSDLKNKFEEMKVKKPWDWQGLVVHEGLQRWRFRNTEHDRVRRDLRGSESNSFGRFLRLRANRRIKEYLQIYPEDSEQFNQFEQNYRNTTKTLYAWYCLCHKEHSVIFKGMPKSVQPLVFGLHKTYLDTLRPNRRSLHLTETIEWLLEHLQSEFGIPNFIRFSKEEVQPPVSQSLAGKPEA